MKPDRINEKYNRIVSLTPTTTETLFALGLGSRAVGVSAACDFPRSAAEIASVGPVFRPDMAVIAELKPDLALAHGLYFERYRTDLAASGVDLFVIEPANVDQILTGFTAIGRLCGSENRANDLVAELTERLGAIASALAGLSWPERPITLRLLEAEPAIVSGPAGFMTDCIRLAGGKPPAYGPEIDPGAEYPSLSPTQLAALDPEAVYLCGWTEEMIDRLKITPGWRDCRAVRQGRLIELACGLACRPGPRVGQLVSRLARALHPDLIGPELVC